MRRPPAWPGRRRSRCPPPSSAASRSRPRSSAPAVRPPPAPPWWRNPPTAPGSATTPVRCAAAPAPGSGPTAGRVHGAVRSAYRAKSVDGGYTRRCRRSRRTSPSAPRHPTRTRHPLSTHASSSLIIAHHRSSSLIASLPTVPRDTTPATKQPTADSIRSVASGYRLLPLAGQRNSFPVSRILRAKPPHFGYPMVRVVVQCFEWLS